MRTRARLTLAAAVLLGAALPARAVALTVFVSKGSPGETWKRGFGGAFGLTLFKLAALEAELARQPYELGDGHLDTFTGAALLAPPIGRFVPYPGLGVGAFLEVDPRKIGRTVAGAPVWSYLEAERVRGLPLLVAVGAAGARGLIRGELQRQGFQEPRDYRCVA